MTILADPATLAILIVAVVLLGMAKGGLAGVGALATPLAALVLPPATAAPCSPSRRHSCAAP